MEWIILILVLAQVFSLEAFEGKEMNKKTMLSKEKDKLSKWSATRKKPFSSKTAIPVKLETVNIEKEEADRVKEIEDTDRLCLSQREESLPDFFLKFGIHTKLITDVTEFNKKMKSAAWLFKKYRGLPSEDRQLMGKGKSRIRNKPLKHNRLPQKSRRRSDNAYVPPCYGFNYLSTIEVVDTETGVPDLDMLSEILSDMSSLGMSKKIVEVIKGCRDFKGECPSDLDQTEGACFDSCVSTRECATHEICCPTQCGGTKCFNPEIETKYRSSDAKIKKKCHAADMFMECLYKSIESKICSNNN
ncbi:hypothetical protein TCAL_00101 [Tigriopus californicus]|uniref:WAP domain-containing protein n=1 Tax=Tigriopus californicus TaxID=6832 RepID=A0A553PI03_TIGCA|nr:uncharacterized protein LOC131880905 isoform X2 [Tigriopus californicus]TRY77287.1 hypothetical protein TCAL_00101 [Tigriopus californicus]|eukprot:TCALIF_00101-PA protein Name:"Protein of unknown function" AED:0.00 eAED:0.00 QI:109/1/0.83/1/0.6/0.83/6/156/301